MGGGRDKRKKAKERKDGPAVGKGAVKTEKHTQRNQEKQTRRTESRLQNDEDDIDALLAKFELEEKAKSAIQVERDCPPPSARVHSSFTPYTAPKTNDIIMFGGEYCNLETDKVYVYSDLYRYHCDKGTWTQIISPNRPPPRSAHQAAIIKGFMYVFGGEFTSPNQERFLHYKDLWRLDLSSHEWDKLDLKAGPSARSGHRMVAYKGKLIVFGGFYDNGKEVRYFNDLWELDVTELKWRAVGDLSVPWPSPRGGFQMFLYGDKAFIYGGYSKVKDSDDEDLEHGKVQDDMWFLDLLTYKFTKVKKMGMAPGPRASFSLVPFKHQALLFGGVSDNEAKGGEDLSSEFHNDLYWFNLNSLRWFAAQLQPPKQTPATSNSTPAANIGNITAIPDTSASSTAVTDTSSMPASPAPSAYSKELEALMAAGQDKNSPFYQAAVRIQSRFRGFVVRKAYKTYRLGGAVSELLYSPAAFGLDLSIRNMPKPRARINAQVAVLGNKLWLLGGIVEVGDKEVTLDDMWCLDLAKMDTWKLVKENTVGEDVFKAVQGSDSDWEEADDDDDEP